MFQILQKGDMKYLMIIMFSILLFSCKRNVVSEIENGETECSKIEHNEAKSSDLMIDGFIGNLNSLIDSGFVVEPIVYKVSKQIEKKFQNQIIPIKICASIRSDDYGIDGEVDSLMVFFENKQHKIFVGRDCFILFEPNQLLSVENHIRLEDYNFDNKPDVAIYNNVGSGTNNAFENIYIFDADKNRFSLNRILSESANSYPDTIDKTISTFLGYGMASMIHVEITYIWKDKELVAVKSVEQDYVKSLNVFVRTEKELKDNIWITKIDTVESQFDPQ